MQYYILIFICMILLTLLNGNAGDFIQFQSAHVALKSGLNPYSPEVLLGIQRNLLGDSHQINEPLMMLSLPWVLPLLCPLGFGSGLLDSLFQWRIWGVLLFFISIFSLFIDGYCNSTLKKNYTLILIAICACAPFLDVFRLNQSSPIFLLSLSLYYIAQRRQNYLLSGLCMSIWIIKPHLFFLIVLFWLVNQRNIKTFSITIITSIAGITFLFLLSEYNYPGCTMMWIDALRYPERTQNSLLCRSCWIGPNLSGLLRVLFDAKSSFFLFFPSSLVCLTIVYLYLRLNFISGCISNLAWIIPLSIFSAPYGWFYDYSLCVVSTSITFKIASTTNRLRMVVTASILFNVLAGIFYFYIASMQHQMWWYPLGCISLYLLAAYPSYRKQEHDFATSNLGEE